MKFDELVKERFSVRMYSNKEIEQEKIDKILEAGRVAPTACNLQPQRIFVIKSEEAREKLKSFCRMTFDAPVIMLMCADMDVVWKNKREEEYNTAEMDLSIVGTHMMLQAWDLGIGSCWVRAFNSKEVKEKFELPDNIKPIFMMPMGYKADDCVPNEMFHNSRNNIEDEVKYL